MAIPYNQTTLWTSTLAQQDDDPHAANRDRLRVSFEKLRARAADLVAQVSGHLPGLTMHDISHLDGLWETASLIIGGGYPVNPLEGYVLGAAFLLHDAALCPEAYVGGIGGLRGSDSWQDAYASHCEQNQNRDASELEELADFEALRVLHAKQAESLPSMSWPTQGDGEIYLIDDTELRNCLGTLIGRLAASHHWSIEELPSLGEQFNSILDFPNEWSIDPVKLACILRCADASHISNDRAPDFLFALIERSGLSLDHWKSQNLLTRVATDTQSADALLIGSTAPFLAENESAWWIAFDAVSVLQREIMSSNALLSSRPNCETSPEFQAKRVKGADSPEELAGYITVEGWEPCAARLHVSNVSDLVANLGGENLYGTNQDSIHIVIRELVQNARDAIAARRAMNGDFEARINVEIQEDDGDLWLSVTDNGIGMSKRVLTGPFLDFGTSFWSSALVREVFPGLRSSKFRSVGKFGIGFYSTFIIADAVEVVSRLWSSGQEDQLHLEFNNGLTLRPLLRKNIDSDGFDPDEVTKVALRLNDEFKDKIRSLEVRHNSPSVRNFSVTLNDYVASTVVGLDESVFVNQGDGAGFTKVHDRNFAHDPSLHAQWLHMIHVTPERPDPNNPYWDVSSYIDQHASRLRVIEADGEILGLAALQTWPTGGPSQLKTTGGLATNIHNRGSHHFFGYMEYLSRSAKRDAGALRISAEVLKIWAEDQRAILTKEPLDDFHKEGVASSLANYGVDPIDFATSQIRIGNANHWAGVSALVGMLETGTDLGILRSQKHGHCTSVKNHPDLGIGIALMRPIGFLSKYTSVEFENSVPCNEFSLVGCVHRAAIERGIEVTWTIHEGFGVDTMHEGADLVVCSANGEYKIPD